MAKRPIAKSAAVEKNLETSMAKLDAAVATRARDAKKFTANTKRLAKRKAALSKRKGVAARRAKRTPSGETRKALRTVVKDLTVTTKELTKARATKAANALELASLKAAQRRANAYAKAIAQVDRALNKKSKRRA